MGGVCRPALALALSLAMAGAAAQGLAALRRDALEQDPAVTAAQAQLRAAAERVNQAEAAFGPTAALTLSRNDTRYNEAPAFELRPFSARQASLQITQPLMHTASWFALQSAQAQQEQAQAQLDQARADATLRLLEAGFDLLKARDAVALVAAQRLAAAEQLASARRSFEVGTVTVVDIREAEAKIDTVDAQALAARADLDLKQQLVSELVGRPVPEWLERGFTGEHMPQLQVAGVLEWIADAQLHSPQLAAARRALEVAEAEVRKAEQGHAPTADLTYNYIMSSDTGTVTTFLPRRGDSSVLGLNVNVPLFASGATQSRVRETLALRDKAQSEVDAARRAVQLGVRQSFTTALSSVGLAHGLETATRSLEAALQANRRGYEVGMKVNAEVLEAQSKVFESRRELSRARYDAWLSYFRLKVYAGRLADADIDELDGLLVLAPPLAPRGRQTAPAQPGGR
jgi:outer membrane protein